MSQSDKTSIVAVASVLGATMIAICLTKTVLSSSLAKKQAQNNPHIPPTFVKPMGGAPATAPPLTVMRDQLTNTPSLYIPPRMALNEKEWSIQEANTPNSCIVIHDDCPKHDENISFFPIYHDPRWQDLTEYPKYIKFNNSGPHMLIQRDNDLIFVDLQGNQHQVLDLNINPPR